MENETTTYEVEYTDTFGGEANYCWVQRAEVSVPIGATEPTVVRAAKKALGLSGVRCRKENVGGDIRLTPIGTATVIFITWKDV